jgi:hypothetical protein
VPNDAASARYSPIERESSSSTVIEPPGKPAVASASGRTKARKTTIAKATTATSVARLAVATGIAGVFWPAVTRARAIAASAAISTTTSRIANASHALSASSRLKTRPRRPCVGSPAARSTSYHSTNSVASRRTPEQPAIHSPRRSLPKSTG